MTINPLVAGVGAALLLGEPLTANVLVGLVAVFVGIWVATGGAERGSDRPAALS